MGRRDRFRWARNARRVVTNWIYYLVWARKCRQVSYDSPEANDRAVRIGTACPHCVCESVSVGRYGSPAAVRSSETLHSILIAPVDFENDQIAMTLLTHAARKGMSVLRESASNDEFQRIIAASTSGDARRHFRAVASLSCSDIRALVAGENGDQRRAGDRLYCVLDTDMDGLPHHADIFATLPRPHPGRGPKAAWRAEREKLMDLMLRNVSTAPQFRGGALINLAANPPQNG